MSDKHEEALERIQARQEKFLGNHMSGNTRAMESVAAQLKALTDGQAAILSEAKRANRVQEKSDGS
jgi:hypothetical protein